MKEEKRTKEEKIKIKIEEQMKEKKRKKRENIIFSGFVLHTKKTTWNYLNFVFIQNCLYNYFVWCYNEFSNFEKPFFKLKYKPVSSELLEFPQFLLCQYTKVINLTNF